MSIVQMCEERCCRSARWCMVQVDRRNVWCPKLLVCYVPQETIVAERGLRRNRKEKDCWKTTWRVCQWNSQASGESSPQDRRKRNLLAPSPRSQQHTRNWPFRERVEYVLSRNSILLGCAWQLAVSSFSEFCSRTQYILFLRLGAPVPQKERLPRISHTRKRFQLAFSPLMLSSS